MVLIPSLDLIVSWNDTKVKGDDVESRALKMLVDAMTRKDKWSSKCRNHKMSRQVNGPPASEVRVP